MLLSSIRQHILDRAIRGQLVPQLPEEGTAEELFQQIQAEKKALIANGTIKKEKPLEPIQEEDIPFEIPATWKWVRLGQILNKLTDGAHQTPAYQPKGIPFLSVKNIATGSIFFNDVKYISAEEHDILFSRCNPEYGDILLSKVGTTGIPAIINTDSPFSIFVSIALLKFSHRHLDKEFLYYLLYSPLVQAQAKKNTRGVGNKNWVLSAIANTLIPIPPLNEQKRITQNIRDIFTCLDSIESSKKRISAIQTELTKRILEQAIQGKLVPQLPEEGNAEELYQQIQAEKQRLIAAGTINKEKPLPPIEEKDLPFDIPETWKWVRLDNLVRKNIKRGKAPVYTEKRGVAVFSQKCNSKRDGINLSLARYLDETKLTLYSAHDFLVPNDIVINSTGEGTLGRVGIFQETDNPNNIKIVPDGHVTIIRSATPVLPLYLYHYLKSRQSILEDACGGSTHQTELRPQFLRELLIPLPPLAEQQRIVDKIEETLHLNNQL